MTEEPLIVYYSATGVTTAFVEKLPFEALLLPKLTKDAHQILCDRKYILITPSYGAGANKGDAIPKQIMAFLSHYSNRLNCIAVMGAGNRSFGAEYQKAAISLSSKLMVPNIYNFEMSGTPTEVEGATKAIRDWWTEYTTTILPQETHR